MRKRKSETAEDSGVRKKEEESEGGRLMKYRME
jgi:hypothetical protein